MVDQHANDMHDESTKPASTQANLLRDAAGFIYVDNLLHPQPTPEDAHHLVNVLRLRAGEVVVAADGAGSFVACEMNVVAISGRNRPRDAASSAELLAVTGKTTTVESPREACVVAFVMPKGERADWTVQKLTELGIDVIVPLMSDRSVVRLVGPECEKRGDRFRRIAKEAGSQSRRIRLPEIPDPQSFADYLDTRRDRLADIAIAEPGGEPLAASTHAIFVGPEGGWSNEELAVVPTRVGMGDTILRAETAAIVAGTMLAERRWVERR